VHKDLPGVRPESLDETWTNFNLETKGFFRAGKEIEGSREDEPVGMSHKEAL